MRHWCLQSPLKHDPFQTAYLCYAKLLKWFFLCYKCLISTCQISLLVLFSSRTQFSLKTTSCNQWKVSWDAWLCKLGNNLLNPMYNIFEYFHSLYESVLPFFSIILFKFVMVCALICQTLNGFLLNQHVVSLMMKNVKNQRKNIRMVKVD